MTLTTPSIPQTAPAAPYTGEVVYVYAFDIAYELSRAPIRELLGQSVAQFQVDASKRNPRQLFFYRAQMVRLPPLERLGPHGPVRVERSVKLLPVGAVSITVRVPFAVASLLELVEFHDLTFTTGQSLYDEVRSLAEDVRRELLPYSIRPVPQLANEEAYTVFCLKTPLPSATGQQTSGEDWLQTHRREVAAVLTQEADLSRLSDQEAADSTSKYISYYDRDLVVIDWDAALIIDEPQNFDETLYLMELANLQLAELEAYDALLDDVIERAYRDLARPHPVRGFPAGIQRSLREIRIDFARMSDEMQNITKFFGEWHLARIYKTIAERFHLADWHRTVDEKLKTVDDLYQLLQSDRNNRMMLTLEILIVVLFIIDLVILFHGK